MKHFLATTILLPAVLSMPLAAENSAHPDLSGIWSYVVALPPGAVRKVVDGKTVVTSGDRGYAAPIGAAVAGALPSASAPAYKPEFKSKVQDLAAHESKTDPVFYCGRPGIPRIGPPRKIVQMPNETLFFYEDMSGDTYRIIPTDGRGHKANANPSYYGESIGRWEGDVFVVDAKSFVDDSWFGEEGYIHSDAMHVVERFWKVGNNMAYQVTVEDPKMLATPWTTPVRVVKPSTEPLEESPTCREADGSLLLNNDHHVQR